MYHGLLPLVLLSYFLTSCGGNSLTHDTSGTIDSCRVFSMSKKDTLGIKMGKIGKRLFQKKMECSGTFVVPKESLYSVSFPFPGYIREIYSRQGETLSKNQPLASIEHPGLIDLQKNYLEQKSQLDYYREEYKRQAELAVEQAASMKKVQLAQSDFKSREAGLQALALQLELIGIDPAALTTETISSTVTLRAPVSGYLYKSNVNPGKYVDPKDELFVIRKMVPLRLMLELAAKDLEVVRKGQEISLHPMNQPMNVKVLRLGILKPSIEIENKNTEADAGISISDPQFTADMRVIVTISLDPDSAFAIPLEALMYDEAGSYILRSYGNAWYKCPVQTGRRKDDFIELLYPKGQLIENMIVITDVSGIIKKNQGGK
jgi:membrane fusion protein, heavy metal efflux system